MNIEKHTPFYSTLFYSINSKSYALDIISYEEKETAYRLIRNITFERPVRLIPKGKTPDHSKEIFNKELEQIISNLKELLSEKN